MSASAIADMGVGADAAHAQAVPVDVLDVRSAERLAQTFRALGDPTRVRVVSALVGRELCVHDLAAALEMTHSAISHQLGKLRDMRLVRARRAGRRAFYALDDDHILGLFQQGLQHVQHG